MDFIRQADLCIFHIQRLKLKGITHSLSWLYCPKAGILAVYKDLWDALIITSGFTLGDYR